MSVYDTTQPRISISRVLSPDDPYTRSREREIGQAEAMGEAMFFLKLGCYAVHVARWNGHIFEADNNFFPGDA